MRAKALFVDPDGVETERDVELAPNNAYPRKWKVGEIVYQLEEKWVNTASGHKLIGRRYVRKRGRDEH
jgi:hypothetical protein